MIFGFTNDKSVYDAAVKFRDDAVDDGWEIKPTYKTEDVNSAASLSRDGFSMMVLARDKGAGKWKYEAKVSIWGPDKLAIRAPAKYDYNKITSGLRKCTECGAEDVDCKRVGFAGRCCAPCLPKAKKKYEYPGWTN